MIGQERFSDITEVLNKKFEEKKALIAVHRGAWGGNIIENTIPSYELALDMGGDIFECDLISSTDGVLYAFHSGTEPRTLGMKDSIYSMSSEQIDSICYINSISEPSGVHVEKFEDIVKHFTDDVIYNIDRAWDLLPQVVEVLNRYPHTKKQVIIKTAAEEKYLRFFENCDDKYMYMPIVKSLDDVERALSFKNINMVGIEIVAMTADSELLKKENLDRILAQNLYIWANVLKLSTKDSLTLYGNMDDDIALLQDKDKGWGEALRTGARILQTDWPLQLSRYRDEYFGL